MLADEIVDYWDEHGPPGKVCSQQQHSIITEILQNSSRNVNMFFLFESEGGGMNP